MRPFRPLKPGDSRRFIPLLRRGRTLRGMKAKPRTTYVTASPATWELIRAAYLSGLSAPTAAARFGVSVGALRKRAQREGWTKRAFVAGGPCATTAVAAPPPLEPGAATDLPPHLASLAERMLRPVDHDPGEVARLSLRLAVRSLASGDPLGALRHARAAALIARLEDVVPLSQLDEDPIEAEARQSAFTDFAFSVAGDLATALITGVDIPPGYLARADAWRRKHEAATAAREGVGDG